MKVVLFCGGLGTRLKEFSDTIPKPMVEIGYRPLIWHLMKYYAYYGHKDFILCLGYRGDYIKNYFLHYDECLSNDFTMVHGGCEIHLYNSDISDWTITFVDTGLNSNLGMRLKAVERYLDGEEVFMANYSDGLSDLNLPKYIDFFHEQDRTACFLSVRPSQSFHHVKTDENGLVSEMAAIDRGDFWINGGYFVFKKEILNYIRDGDELVAEPFRRLIAEKQLVTYRNPGFWACMDTFKEKTQFDDMCARGEMPWVVWEDYGSTSSKRVRVQAERTNGDRVLLDRSHLVAHYHPDQADAKQSLSG